MTQPTGARRRDPRTREVPPSVRSAVAALVEAVGAKQAAARLGVSPGVAKSVASGEWVMPGTLAILEAACGEPKGAA